MKIRLAILLLCVTSAAWASQPPDNVPLNGVVLEKIDAGNYTYLRLKTADGEIWAATLPTPITVGTRITIQDPSVMAQFESKALHRTFDQIVFGSVIDVDPTQTAASAHAAAEQPADVPDAKIAHATGPDACTVAEVFAGRGTLRGKSVTVRGKVVRYSADIMGRNWLHLRDGTGSAKDKSNDLLITTQETAAVGDVVQARGIVRTNQDFGGGYAYEVLLEGATLRE